MSVLLNIIPAPYRWLALAALALALFGFGFVKGAEHEESAQAARDLATERGTVKLAGQRVAVSAKVDAQVTPVITKIKTVTKETISYVPVYVPTGSCPLPGGFRVLHDAAAQGLLPDAAGIPDAAAVAPDAAAETVVGNYGTCLENAARLDGLQEWVREQLRLNPPQ